MVVLKRKMKTCLRTMEEAIHCEDCCTHMDWNKKYNVKEMNPKLRLVWSEVGTDVCGQVRTVNSLPDSAVWLVSSYGTLLVSYYMYIPDLGQVVSS